MEYIHNSDKITVTDYPYGFRLRTTLFDSIEFSPTKGFRHVTQTINPKNGRENKPKKSTYYPIMIRFKNEDGHIKTWSSHANGDQEINNAFQMIGKHYDLFTPEQKKYLQTLLASMIRVSHMASVQWGKKTLESANEVYKPLHKKILANTELENIYSELKIDAELLITELV